MGLSSSMWTSVSGLLAHGEKMNVISNNLANVSTIGFKSQRMDFEDFLYQDKASGSGPTQIGFGVGINTVITDFSQGSFESTNSATDLAISGSGYFKVVNSSTNADHYTRAGNFNFNNQGYLTLPTGEVLQGWKVQNHSSPLPATGINPLVSKPQGIQTVGDAQDIVLDSWSVSPQATTKVEFSVNLTAEENLDKSIDIENPLFAMSETWNGKYAVDNPGEPAISEEAYVYPAPITVYDEGGKEHTLTCYFDQVPAKSIDGLPTGYTAYEYLLTMDPNEDARTFGGTYDEATGVLTGATSFQDTEAAGILMKGTMIFDSSGNLISQSAYSYMGNTEVPAGETIPGGKNPEEIIAAAELAGANALADPANITAIEAAALAAANTALGNVGADKDTSSTAVAEAAAEAAAIKAANEANPGLAAGDAAWDATYNTELAAFDRATAKKEAENIWQNAFDKAKTDESNAVYNAAYGTEYSAQIATSYGHPDSALSWQPTAVSENGYPLFTANFSGHPMANSVGQSKTDTDTTKSKEADDIWMEFDLGLQSESPNNPWSMGGTAGTTPIKGTLTTPGTSIADLMTNLAGGTATSISYSQMAGLVPAEGTAGSSTNRGTASAINFSSQNGYPSGNLTNARIDADGVLYGIYSNGVEMPLYQIAMYDFVNPQGLYREGGNLYSETLESGSIQQAQAGIAGMGSIHAYNIEQSNVDMSREFVQMITTQRGFQGNSKGITTVDTMLEQVLSMKR